MGGNYGSYLSSARSGGSADWSFDVTKVSISAAMFYGYVSMVPLGIYLTLRCFAGVNTSLVNLICMYGYALSVYVPAGPYPHSLSDLKTNAEGKQTRQQ
jgi:hypothetical protein